MLTHRVWGTNVLLEVMEAFSLFFFLNSLHSVLVFGQVLKCLFYLPQDALPALSWLSPGSIVPLTSVLPFTHILVFGPEYRDRLSKQSNVYSSIPFLYFLYFPSYIVLSALNATILVSYLATSDLHSPGRNQL